MKIPRTPERRITPLFGSVGFCSRKGHSLAIFAHTLSPIVLAKSAEDYSWEIAEWQLARRSIGASYAEVCLFCHSGFFDTCFQSILRMSPTGRKAKLLTLDEARLTKRPLVRLIYINSRAAKLVLMTI